MIFRKNILSILIIFGLTACSERIDFNQEFQPKIDLVSEISPGSIISVKASTSGGLEMGTPIEFPHMEILLTKENGEINAVRGPIGDGFYINDQVQLEEGQNYTITAKTQNQEDGIPPVMAQTMIPFSTAIVDSGFEILNPVYSVAGTELDNAAVRAVDLNIEINYDDDSEDYFHLIAYNKVASQLIPLDITVLGENADHAEVVTHREGVLIDNSNLKNRNFELILSTKDAVEIDTDDLHELVFELRTTTRDYFTYHKKLSAQILSSVVQINDPIINFTNIENGLGIFVGYSVHSQNFQL